MRRAKEIANIHITSFHEAVRLGQKTVTNTEEAQYSTSFPCAVALVHNNVLPEHVAEKALKNPEVQRLSSILTMGEDERANLAFPEKRFAKADITLIDGQILSSTWFEPRWDFEDPPTETELVKKFYDFAKPVLGQSRTKEICDAVFELDKTDTQHLFALISSPTKKRF